MQNAPIVCDPSSGDVPHGEDGCDDKSAVHWYVRLANSGGCFCVYKDFVRTPDASAPFGYANCKSAGTTMQLGSLASTLPRHAHKAEWRLTR